MKEQLFDLEIRFDDEWRQEIWREGWGYIYPPDFIQWHVPLLFPGEVEIARIELNSAGVGITSIRARPVPDGILYRAVDSGNGVEDDEIILAIDHTPRPLSFHGLIKLIDSAKYGEYFEGLVFGFADFSQPDSSPEDMVNFFYVSSEFYPEISSYYQYEMIKWYKDQDEEWLNEY